MAVLWGEPVLTVKAWFLAMASVVASVALLLPLSPADASGASPAPSPNPSGSPSDAGRVVTFGIGPATKGKVDRRANFNLLLTKGNSAKDQVALVNLAYEPITLNLYASDAVNTPDGQLSLQPAATAPKDLAKWVTLKTPTGKGYVVVPPRSTVVVPFSVEVPDGAYVGDHLAGIVASSVTRGQAPGDRTTDVQFEQRIAVRLAVRVAGELQPQLVVENMRASYAGSLNPLSAGTATVTYTVRNVGNIRLGGSQALAVGDLFGGTVQAENLPDIPLLLPGGSATVTVVVPEVRPMGLMTATVHVTPLAAAGDANPPVDVAIGTVQFWAVPWILLALLLLLILLVLLALRRRRRRPAESVGRRVADAPLAGTSA